MVLELMAICFTVFSYIIVAGWPALVSDAETVQRDLVDQDTAQSYGDILYSEVKTAVMLLLVE